jgi:hypothetical protein
MVYFHPIFGTTPDHINERLVFVLMPFEDELTKIYESIVKPVVESKNLDCRRADDYLTTKAIIQNIWRAICESRLVIADTTGLNSNVMYELGIAHAVGKNTIIIHQRKEQDNRFPFDLAHIMRIEYENNIVGAKKLEHDIGQTLSSVLEEKPLSKPITEMISESSEPVRRTISVERAQTQDNIKLTLHSIEFKDTETIAHLAIENDGTDEINFFGTDSHAVQGRRQFRVKYSSIHGAVPTGIQEEGYVYFNPIDYNQARLEFNFVIWHHGDLKFNFEIEL